MVLGGNETREDADAARLDDEIVVSAAISLTSILDDAHPAPIASVVERQLLQTQHTVRDAVRGHVHRLARKVVEREHASATVGKIMLEGQ